MAHTKGKWEAQGRSIFAFNKSGHNRFACSVNSGCHCGCEEPALIEELEANARLIASAPELLEALKEAQKVLLICKPIMSHYPEPQEAYAKVSIQIEQAIARAEEKE